MKHGKTAKPKILLNRHCIYITTNKPSEEKHSFYYFRGLPISFHSTIYYGSMHGWVRPYEWCDIGIDCFETYSFKDASDVYDGLWEFIKLTYDGKAEYLIHKELDLQSREVSEEFLNCYSKKNKFNDDGLHDCRKHDIWWLSDGFKGALMLTRLIQPEPC